MSVLKLEATNVYKRNYEALQSGKYRFIINQGGTRSSKTYSIAQIFITLLYQESGQVFTIVRKTLPALKFSAMKDFFDIMKDAEIYEELGHNKTELTYRENDNEVEFLAVDQPQKIRGRKRKILWMNEANEMSYEDFQQLNLRTTGTIFMDYNPSDEFHWIYEQVLTRKDSCFIQSTYKDNTFLDKETVAEIERLKEVDKNYWKIYGLGERGTAETTIYTHWQYCDKLPEGGELVYGLDFGYNNATALTANKIYDDNVYSDETLYESHVTNSDLIDHIKGLGIKTYIYCDSAEPGRIEELQRAGIKARPSNKSVTDGIDTLKARKWFITKRSVNLLKEIRAYRWKEKPASDKNDPDEPVQVNDHALDSVRYAVHTHLTQQKPQIYVG